MIQNFAGIFKTNLSLYLLASRLFNTSQRPTPKTQQLINIHNIDLLASLLLNLMNQNCKTIKVGFLVSVEALIWEYVRELP